MGTVDAPDSRYAGPPVPDVIARGLQRVFGVLPTAPLTPFQEHSFWRCMGGKVYACAVGANLPCQSKADTSRTPNEGMTVFCRDNPNADGIPAVATGRETIYAWRCTDGAPTNVPGQASEPKCSSTDPGFGQKYDVAYASHDQPVQSRRLELSQRSRRPNVITGAEGADPLAGYTAG